MILFLVYFEKIHFNSIENSTYPMFSLEEYFYHLPEELIAQEAVHPHHDAKLMVINRWDGSLVSEDTFWNLDKYIPENWVLFFNNSRVIPARIPLKNHKIIRWDMSEGLITQWEILFCKNNGGNWFEALVRPGSKFKKGTKIFFNEGYLEVVDQTESGRLLEAHGIEIYWLMEKYGELPLPPYIHYDEKKEKDYQTVFAEKNGSVAAPTASLHFTHALLEKIQNEKYYISLHVWLGTFKGIDVDDIRDYKIHGETIEIPQEIFETIARLKTDGKKIIGVGTTVCRTLESLPYLWDSLTDSHRHEYSENTQSFWNQIMINKEDYISNTTRENGRIFFETRIYLYPGKKFHIIDELITNFHVPKSSLLVLVSAFLGKKLTDQLYQYAVEKKYRFFSFWDGMYIKNSEKK